MKSTVSKLKPAGRPNPGLNKLPPVFFAACTVISWLGGGTLYGADRLSTLSVTSRCLGGERTVRIYLPASYEQELQKRYAVLYVHDGQNVFSSAGTNAAFGWGNWELDETTHLLSQSGKMQELILVAIDNSPSRYAEYGGTAWLPRTSQNPAFTNYANFLINELKPKLDREYRTRPGRADTGALGSSMGGICSMRLAWEHPEVFGRAASLSGAFQVETNFIAEILRAGNGNSPLSTHKPNSIRLYFDSGVVDFMGGDDGNKGTERVVAELRRLGWDRELQRYLDAKPLTLPELESSGLRRDKWAEAQTSQHNEFYWRRRVGRALTFLFPPTE